MPVRLWVALALLGSLLVPVGSPSVGASTPTGGGFAGVSPFRVLDTRQPGGGGCVTSTREVTVTGVGGVPVGAAAVVVNVTVVNPSTSGFLTVFPAGEVRPPTSNLNFVAGQVVPNQVSVKVGAGGRVALFASGGCPQVVVDLQGFHTAGTPGAGGFAGITPARSGDTRQSGGCVPPGASRNFQVAGVGGVPTDATTAVVNLTAVAPPSPGFFTVYPAGVTRPTASTLNVAAGQVVANAATAKIGAGGAVTVFNGTGACANVVLDVVGYFTGGVPTDVGGGIVGILPFRVVDTRTTGGCIPADSSRTIPVTGVGGVPADAAAVALNVTAVRPTAGGFLTVFPNGNVRPESSNLNFTTGAIVANAVNVRVGSAGSIVVFNGSGGCTHVVVDAVAHHRPLVPNPTVPAPVVTTASPASGPGAGGTSVTVTGTNLTGATAVTFGAAAATSFTVNSATRITATSPAGVGQVDVRVTTPGGRSPVATTARYTYVAVTGVSPPSGPIAGGTQVTITGSGLTGATAVTFGGTAATSFTVNSATQITATTPARPVGQIDVRVTTPSGTSPIATAATYTYVTTVDQRCPLGAPENPYFRFLALVDGCPIRWDPCAPIPWRYNPTNASRPFDEIQSVFDQVARATGLRFEYQGTTTTRSDEWMESSGYGLVMEWSEVPGSAIGLARLSWRSSGPGSGYIRRSAVLIEPNLGGSGGDPRFWQDLMLHELGHAVGLEHVDERSERMYPVILSPGRGTFGSGDLQGLRYVGQDQGCAAPTLRSVEERTSEIVITN